MDAPVMIAPEIAELLEGGDVAVWVATASVECVPQASRCMGVRVDRDRGVVRLLLPSEQGVRVLANARVGADISATFVRIHDYRAVQVKGRITSVRQGNDHEHAWAQRYTEAFIEANVRVGMPREVVRHLVWWPSDLVEVSVRELFVQTPGPNAGTRL